MARKLRVNDHEITTEEFDAILTERVKDEINRDPRCIWGLPGVYEALSEAYNNEVLDIWESRLEATS